MKKYFLLFLIIISISSCKKYDKNGREIKDFDELEKANWLLGSWEFKNENGTLQEIWTSKNDSTFAGQSYFINKKDTIHNETIDLIEDNGILKYVATIKGENQNLPTTFNFSETEENELKFENPKHDYPSLIFYKFKDSLNIEIIISGKQLGKNSSEVFKMVKKK